MTSPPGLYFSRSTTRLPYKPRLLNWLYAFLMCHFWKRCPNCNRYFGGHESAGIIYDGVCSGKITCRACSTGDIEQSPALLGGTKG
jgi:hypothetical protein